MFTARMLGAVLGLLCILRAQEPPRIASGPLAIEDVIQMSKAGVSDELIIARVKRNAKAFDFNTAEIVELRKSGVSETVIKYLVDPSLPYSPPTPVVAPAGAAASAGPTVAGPPLDPLLSKIPPEIGIYYSPEEEMFLPLDQKTLVPTKQPGGKFSIPGLKGHIIGAAIGSNAKVRVAPDAATFYARLGEKGSIDDLTLLRMDRGDKRRQLDFGTKAGKATFRVQSILQFDSKQVAPGLYRLSVATKSAGEFLFFILGSGDDKKGTLGKGYDFGVD
jgi:hypothetical protein